MMKKVIVSQEMLEVVPCFCHLGDCLSSGGGCGLATITRCRVAWGKFNEFLPVLTSRGRVYNPCIRSAMLHASKTWAQPYLTRITTKDQVGSQDLFERMQLNTLRPR